MNLYRIFQIGIIIFVISLLNCSIKDIIDISNDPTDINVKPWPYEVNIPVFYKTYNMTEFYETFPEFTGSYAQETPAMPAWPVAPLNAINIATTDSITLGTINIDFNGTPPADATVNKFRSTNASISLKFTLFDNTKTVEHAIDLTNISSPVLTVNGDIYNFSNGTVSGNSVVFTSGFLTSTTDYCISASTFNAGPLDFTLLDQPASFLPNDIMVVEATFDFGSNAEAIVSILADIEMINTTIPLNDIPFIDNFSLDIEFDNSLANEFEIIIDGTSFPIAPGNVAYSTAGDHYYAASSVITNSHMTLSKTGTNPTIIMKIKASQDFQTQGTTDIRLARNGKISAKVVVNGKTE